MAESTEQKKSVSGYIEKAKNLIKDNLINLEKVTSHTKKQEADLETKETIADSVTIHAKVSVNNPYNIDISILNATYDFTYGHERKRVKGNLQGDYKLKAKTKNMLDVLVKVSQSSLTSTGNDHHTDIDYKLDMILVIDIHLIGEVIIPVTGNGKFARPTTTTTMHMSDFLSDQGEQNEIIHHEK